MKAMMYTLRGSHCHIDVASEPPTEGQSHVGHSGYGGLQFVGWADFGGDRWAAIVKSNPHPAAHRRATLYVQRWMDRDQVVAEMTRSLAPEGNLALYGHARPEFQAIRKDRMRRAALAAGVAEEVIRNWEAGAASLPAEIGSTWISSEEIHAQEATRVVAQILA